VTLFSIFRSQPSGNTGGQKDTLRITKSYLLEKKFIFFILVTCVLLIKQIVSYLQVMALLMPSVYLQNKKHLSTFDFAPDSSRCSWMI